MPATSAATTPELTVRGGLRRLPVLRAVLVAVVAGLLSAGSSPAVAADTCANAAVRAQNGSTGLPDCRAYEMVTPPYKEGFTLLGSPRPVFTDDGVISYESRGSFAGDAHGSSGNLYHGVRAAAGWETRAIGPSSALYSTSLEGQLALPASAESSDLRWSLWRMSRRDEPEANIGFWLRGPDGGFTRVGNFMPPEGGNPDFVGLGVQGTSADMSHVVVSNGGGSAIRSALREYVGVNNGWPPRPVSIDNDGQPTLGESCLRSVSPDGRVIVFSSGCNGGLLRLWARVAGSTLVAVSGSECTRGAEDVGGLCNGLSAADYVGGAADGSRVFFTTKQQLVNGDIDTGSDVNPSDGNDLYACDIPAGVPVPVGSANACSTLTEVSGAGDDAEVQSVVAISQDGSRVYFVARGVLADNLGVNGVAPRAGSDNLYVWDRDSAHPAGQTRYVARLGGAGNDLGQGGQMTPDGRYLLFTTANSLVTSGAGEDVDSARDAYLYDVSTHSIVRLSTSVAGGGGNGPGGFDVSTPSSSAMTADGSTVVFDSAEALADSDTNGTTDVYSWHDGQVSLISAGGGGAVGITPSGRDIFFGTDARLLAADGDNNGDIYDARVGGGFEQAQSSSPCSGDQCQGQLGQPPNLDTAIDSDTNLSGPNVFEKVPIFRFIASASTPKRGSSSFSISVSAQAAGTVKVSGSGLATISKQLEKAGTMKVTVKLGKAAKAKLKKKHSLKVKARVVYSRPNQSASAQTVSVTLKA